MTLKELKQHLAKFPAELEDKTVLLRDYDMDRDFPEYYFDLTEENITLKDLKIARDPVFSDIYWNPEEEVKAETTPVQAIVLG